MSKLFLKVDKDLFNSGLNPIEILVLSQVIEFENNKAQCFMTDAQFAENFGVSAKTISRTLDKLEESGYISRKTITLSSKRVRTITTKSNGQNDSLNLKQTKCPSETDKMSNSNGQNDFIKDNIKDNTKDKFTKEFVF
jgi:DNA-binding MarR family transcriptional regulator